MTNKYRSRGHRPPSPPHPSCFTADKEKIVNCFFRRLIPYLCSYEKNKWTHKQLGKHPAQRRCWPEGSDTLFHEDGWSSITIYGLHQSPSVQSLQNYTRWDWTPVTWAYGVYRDSNAFIYYWCGGCSTIERREQQSLQQKSRTSEKCSRYESPGSLVQILKMQ